MTRTSDSVVRCSAGDETGWKLPSPVSLHTYNRRWGSPLAPLNVGPFHTPTSSSLPQSASPARFEIVPGGSAERRQKGAEFRLTTFLSSSVHTPLPTPPRTPRESTNFLRMTGGPSTVQVDVTSSFALDSKNGHLIPQTPFYQETGLGPTPRDDVRIVPRLNGGQKFGIDCTVVRRSSP